MIVVVPPSRAAAELSRQPEAADAAAQGHAEMGVDVDAAGQDPQAGRVDNRIGLQPVGPVRSRR